MLSLSPLAETAKSLSHFRVRNESGAPRDVRRPTAGRTVAEVSLKATIVENVGSTSLSDQGKPINGSAPTHVVERERPGRCASFTFGSRTPKRRIASAARTQRRPTVGCGAFKAGSLTRRGLVRVAVTTGCSTSLTNLNFKGSAPDRTKRIALGQKRFGCCALPAMRCLIERTTLRLSLD